MPQESNQKTIIIATIAFIVGFALAWFISANKTGIDSTAMKGEQSDTSEEVMTAASTTPNFISVKNQAAGLKVVLEKAAFETAGWVVIHEEDNSAPGRILGAQLFDAGTWADGTVDLLRGTLAGQSYYAVLHSENGDRAFDPKTDTPILGADGTPVLSKFSATGDATSSN